MKSFTQIQRTAWLLGICFFREALEGARPPFLPLHYQWFTRPTPSCVLHAISNSGNSGGNFCPDFVSGVGI
jgi:hypothetical protein